MVPVTEISVVVATSSPTRRDSIKATEFLVDGLKKTLPIWKKEFYSDGAEAVWKENKCVDGMEADQFPDTDPPAQKVETVDICVLPPPVIFCC